MSSTPLVSIIVPVYNRQSSIECCLNSILGQNVRDFELIVVDDGSTDGGDLICARLAQQDGRVRFVRQENKGVSSARNLGLDMAQGEYVTFIDSDDAVLPNHLDIVSIERSSDADLLMCDYGYGRIVDGVVQSLSRKIDFVRKESPLAASYLFNDYATVEKIPFYVWNKFFKRSIIEANHVRFDVSVSLGEDSIFVFQYLSFAGKVVHYNVKTHIFIPWENLINLSTKTRTPEDYLHCYKESYVWMKSLVGVAGEAAEKMAVNLGIKRPIRRILYDFTTWNKRKKISQRELIRFTDTEIVPFLRSIDTVRFHAENGDVRFVYYLLMNWGGGVAVVWCWLTSPIRVAKSFISGILSLSL